MKIELSDEAIEDIMCATLKEHIKYAKKNIRDLNAKKNLKDFEEEDLIHNMTMLVSLKAVYEYFGGDL